MSCRSYAAAVAAILVASRSASTAQGVENAPETADFVYAEDFESGHDPFQFWLSYDKQYTVNAKGVTDEHARSGARSFKLDVTFDQTSRFLWRIPLQPPVPVGESLSFSAYVRIDEPTTGRATLGVSMALPPTRHSGCTAPSTFLTTTDGKWHELREDMAARSRGVAQTVTGHYQSGVAGDHVAPVVESIIVDLRGEAGQRVVLYVDDIDLRGTVPTAAAHQADLARRWGPVKAALDNRLAGWNDAIAEAVVRLGALGDLSPRARRLRDELLAKAGVHRKTLAAVSERGYLNIAEPSALDGFVSTLSTAVRSIRALSTAEEEGQPVLLTVTRPISSVRVLPSEPSLPGSVGAGLELTAARGEYEPASLVITAFRDLDGLRLTATPLRSDKGTIPDTAVDIRFVKCWYQAGTAWSGIRQDRNTRVLTPELLLKDPLLVNVDEEKKENYLKLRRHAGEEYVWISDPTEVRTAKPWPLETYPVRDSETLLPIGLRADRNQQVWITVQVPEDAHPGAYTGTLVLLTSEDTVAHIPLRLEVLPFDLLPPYYTSSMDYHGRLDPAGRGSIGSWLKTREQFRNELANMVAHGLRNCQHYSIRKDILAEVLRIRAEVGMDNTTLYLKNTIPIGSPTDPEALAKIKADVRDIIDFVTPFGTKTVYFYGIDELRGEELAAQRPAWQAVREAGGKIFVAGWGDNVELMGDIQDMHVRAGPPSREEVEKWHACGHRIFCYANPQTGVENPVVYRRNFGLLLWKFDYDGAATNAYQHTFGATWNDFDHNVFRAHTIAYPTENGVVDTIAWEGYREGVDDVRYITTLQEAAAVQSTSPEHARAAADARTFLRGLKTSRDIETGDLDAIRAAIIRHLLDLHRAAQPR